jgi:hypothetical protein
MFYLIFVGEFFIPFKYIVYEYQNMLITKNNNIHFYQRCKNYVHVHSIKSYDNVSGRTK